MRVEPYPDLGGADALEAEPVRLTADQDRHGVAVGALGHPTLDSHCSRWARQ
jgi:hypothetical protein